MFLLETTSLCPGDNFFVPTGSQRQLRRFDVCQARSHLNTISGHPARQNLCKLRLTAAPPSGGLFADKNDVRGGAGAGAGLPAQLGTSPALKKHRAISPKK